MRAAKFFALSLTRTAVNTAIRIGTPFAIPHIERSVGFFGYLLMDKGIAMMTKIYISLWALYLFVVGAFYITGNATPMAIVVFGFICFGMVFMGIMGVLPTAVHDTHVKH